jgi:hypothetical protein
MRKEKVSLYYRLIHFFTYHHWLKLISLALAILSWLFVRGEIGRVD